MAMRWLCNPVSQVQVLEGAYGRLTQLDRVPRLHRGSCRFKSCIVHFAPVAQLAEHALGKCEVIRFDPDQELHLGVGKRESAALGTQRTPVRPWPPRLCTDSSTGRATAS